MNSRRKSFSSDRCERSSCSQIRTTLKPSLRRSRVMRRARVIFDFNLLAQYVWLVCGKGRRHFGQPCQKQPSMKTTILELGKKKSGIPDIERTCIFQPLMPRRINAERNFHSVERLPLERTLCMRRLRSSTLKISTGGLADREYRGARSSA